MSQPRLLYLGFVFPPELHARHAEINPAGQLFETNLLKELEKAFDLRSASAIPVEVSPSDHARYLAQGKLLLLDRAPELIHWRNALGLLQQTYSRWRSQAWQPDIILIYNFSPIYNGFLRSLEPAVPRRCVLLADSTSLGRPQPLFKRLRYALKPFIYFDDQMLPFVDCCIGLSRDTEKFFAPRGIPWLWMPGACAPERARFVKPPSSDGPVNFGYFGSLGDHAGLPDLLQAFCSTKVEGKLHISGHGKQADAIAKSSSADPRIEFHGLLPSPDDCLKLASKCDVLVNPRPLISGNENNFPSKIFEYALSGRAILTTAYSGVSEVLGPDAYYLDQSNLRQSLAEFLRTLSATPKPELRARGARLHERVTTQYSWAVQGTRMTDFLERSAKI